VNDVPGDAPGDQLSHRKAAPQLVADYHDAQLRDLLEHVRRGFDRLDRGEIDVFDLDDVVQRYRKAATKLQEFCGSSGAQWEHAAGMLELLRGRGEEPDWWEAGAPDRR
jgi:hypothetical protein